MSAPKTTPFAQWLDERIKEQQISIRALGKRLSPENPELGRRALHRYLSGTNNPTRQMQGRIAQALGVEPPPYVEPDKPRRVTRSEVKEWIREVLKETA